MATINQKIVNNAVEMRGNNRSSRKDVDLKVGDVRSNARSRAFNRNEKGLRPNRQEVPYRQYNDPEFMARNSLVATISSREAYDLDSDTIVVRAVPNLEVRVWNECLDELRGFDPKESGMQYAAHPDVELAHTRFRQAKKNRDMARAKLRLFYGEEEFQLRYALEDSNLMSLNFMNEDPDVVFTNYFRAKTELGQAIKGLQKVHNGNPNRYAPKRIPFYLLDTFNRIFLKFRVRIGDRTRMVTLMKKFSRVAIRMLESIGAVSVGGERELEPDAVEAIVRLISMNIHDLQVSEYGPGTGQRNIGDLITPGVLKIFVTVFRAQKTKNPLTKIESDSLMRHSLITRDMILRLNPYVFDRPEGNLLEYNPSIVNTDTKVRSAKDISIGEYLLVGENLGQTEVADVASTAESSGGTESISSPDSSVKSDLNGSHGEATNSDDVETGEYSGGEETVGENFMKGRLHTPIEANLVGLAYPPFLELIKSGLRGTNITNHTHGGDFIGEHLQMIETMTIIICMIVVVLGSLVVARRHPLVYFLLMGYLPLTTSLSTCDNAHEKPGSVLSHLSTEYLESYYRTTLLLQLFYHCFLKRGRWVRTPENNIVIPEVVRELITRILQTIQTKLFVVVGFETFVRYEVSLLILNDVLRAVTGWGLLDFGDMLVYMIILVVGAGGGLLYESNIFRYLSSGLNGANGEFTGSDDVSKRDQAAKRIHQKRKKDKGVRLQTKDSAISESVVVAVVGRDDDLDAFAPQSQEVQPEIQRPFVVVHPYDGVCDQPVLDPKGMMARVSSTTGELLCRCADGTFMPARVRALDQLVKLSSGIYVYEPGAPICDPEPAFLLAQWSIGPMVVKRWVLVQAFEELQKQFLNPIVDERNINAIMAFVQKQHPSLGKIYSANVVDYFVAGILAYRAEVQSRPYLKDLIRRPETLVKLDVSESIARPCSDLPKSTGLGGIFHSFGVPNPLEDLTDNGNFRIVTIKGGVPRAGHRVLVDFNTQRNPRPHLYRTWFFRLASPGIDHQFVQYDRDGANATKATARMYKARPGEDQLVANQHAVFRFLNYDASIDHYVSNQYRTASQFDEFIRTKVSNADPGTLAAVQDHYQSLIDEKMYPHLQRGKMTSFFWKMHLITCNVSSYLHGLYVAQVSREALLEMSFPKRMLYKTWYAALGWMYGVYTPFDCRPVAKVKVEFGKPGKLARLYVSYDECILQAGYFYQFLKKALCQTYIHNSETNFPYRHEIRYSKLSDSFIFGQPGFFSRSFSDDSEDVIIIPGYGNYRIVSDVSSCDASMRSGLFRMSGRLFAAIGARHLIQSVFNPFTSPITLVNPSNSAEVLKMKPVDVFMGSGSPDTTHMNNLYNYGIKMAVYREICIAFGLAGEPGVPIVEDVEAVLLACYERGASCMGAVTTQKICATVEQSDFLKEVTFSTPEGLVVSLSLGPILRGLGGVDGDLTAAQLNISPAEFRRLSDVEKMEMFVGGVVKGLCHEPSNILLDALRDRFTEGNVILSKHSDSISRRHLVVPTLSLMDRYGGTQAEWQILADDIRCLCLGDYLVSPILANIYKVDYDLPKAPG